MTRNEYLEYRNTTNPTLIYEYYKENIDSSRYKTLRLEEFFALLPLWTNINSLYNKLVEYLDNKFNIVKLSDKEGNIIKFL